MARILVAVEDIPGVDGHGVVQLTYKSWRPSQYRIATLSGGQPHGGIEEYSSTVRLPYFGLAERDEIIKSHPAID